MAYLPSKTQQLTFDTDDGRIDSHPCIIVLPSGQQIVFYSKFLTTGKVSFSRIQFTAPSFTVTVEAGSGSVNGSSVTWGAGTVVATQNSYQIVYVTVGGALGIGSNLSMGFLKDVILLAYINSGNTSITKISELERTGNYIYVRKQVLSGNNWVWNDYELFLNTGSEPKCFFDSTAGKIHLTYEKDSVSYIRVFNPLDELTWEYLTSTEITANTITFNSNPQNTLHSGISSGQECIVDVYDSDLYPMSSTGFSFINGQTYIFLPIVGGSYLQYVRTGIVTYDILRMFNGSYEVEATYETPYLYRQCMGDSFRLWTGTLGLKYIRVKISTALFASEFITPPQYYKQFPIYSSPAQVSVDGTGYTVDTRDETLRLPLSSGQEAVIAVTSEYIETKAFYTDNVRLSSISSGQEATIITTAEYLESKTFHTDNIKISPISSGEEATLAFTNH